MKINSVQKNYLTTTKFRGEEKESSKLDSASMNFTPLPLGNIYGVKINKTISFGHYEGDLNPSMKFYYVVSGKHNLKKPEIDPATVYYSANDRNKKWIAGVNPSDVLKESPKLAIEKLVYLATGENKIPKNIETPDFGNNWGRHANYIEINPRILGKMEGNRCSEGILGAIKFLNLIPPSGNNNVNCVILSQLYPNIYGDGYNKPQWEENSLYTIKIEPHFNCGISENLTVNNMKKNGISLSPLEQVKTFNDLAHLKGLKTGFRMLLSEDQIKIGYGEQFRWSNPDHVEMFIDMCVNGINMGFDSIYFDSARHVGNYDMEHYAGVGATPSYELMQYITYSIRERTGRCDLSFVGEKCDNDAERYKNMGLNAGTDFADADDFNKIVNYSKKLSNSRVYASGVEVSNDNDCGAISYEQRLNKMKSCLFGYENKHDKLPSFMQMHDIYPLNHYTNTHDIMLHNPRFSDEDDYNKHFENLFAKDDNARDYSNKVNELFAYYID